MKIAFLGTGRMGLELARHLLADHELRVWNRTRDKAEPLADGGAVIVDTPAEAVEGAEVVITSLFGPDTVREVVISPQLIPAGITWVDTTTVSPDDTEEFAAAVPTYVAVPVVGTLGPAREGKLGIYVGTADAERREQVGELVKPWADPERLFLVDSPRTASVGKLLANLALAVAIEGLREALRLGTSNGIRPEEVLDMLDGTALAFVAKGRGAFVRGERDASQADFTVDAIAKDTRLMLASSQQDLPAVRAALLSLEAEQQAGRGSYDFTQIALDH